MTMTKQRMGALAGGLLCAVVAVTGMRYLVGIGPLPERILGNLAGMPMLMVHIAAATIALLVAPIQFSRKLRQKRPVFHRWTGRLYAVGCIVGGITGIPLAFGSTAGPVATAGFGLLAVAWTATTVQAWRTAMQRRFVDHRRWMIRSFALTCAAVTLRLYLPIGAALPWEFVYSYRAISFLCWVPNILMAEYLLRTRLASGVNPTRPQPIAVAAAQ